MKRLLLVDLSAIFWRNWHATKDQELGNAFESTIAKVRWIASSGYDGVGVCCDSPPYWRKEVSADYKSQRDTPEPAAVDQLRRVMERLEKDGFPLWKAPTMEADDVIASATKWAVAQGHAVHVASADKDLMALVMDGHAGGGGVQIRSTATDDVYDQAKVVEKFGVVPASIPDYLALIGDKSDNVAGVPGVGPVKARELVNKYESVPQLLAALRANVIVGTPAIQAALKAAQQDGTLEKALELVTLHSGINTIDWSEAFKPREEKPLENSEVTDAEFEEAAKEAALPAEPAAQPEQESPAPKSTALALPPAQGSYSTALEPRTFNEAWVMAKVAVNSRSFGVANNETALAMILRGREFGLGAITSLSAFHVIKNKMCLTATMIEGMVQNAECCEYFMCIESTDKTCTYETKRRGYPKAIAHTWVIEDAARLGLTSLDQWKKQPRTMLRHRCGTDLARMVFADVVAGLYSTEEMDDQ